MSVARVTEISATSTESFEAAVREAIARASKTLRHIEGAWVKEQEVRISDGEITDFKVILKVTFLLEDPQA